MLVSPIDISFNTILLSFLSSHHSSFCQEINHLHVAAVLMTIIMIIAFLTSIAIVRRILMATSVLKVCMVLNPLASHAHCFLSIFLSTHQDELDVGSCKGHW